MKNIAIVVDHKRAYTFNLLGHGEDKGKWYQQGYTLDKEQLDTTFDSVAYFEYQDEADTHIKKLREEGAIF